jgi:hypothetical protein
MFTQLTHITQLVLTLAPHGGQRVARRNAWAAMSTDSARARARREADAAMAIAHHRAQRQARAL